MLDRLQADITSLLRLFLTDKAFEIPPPDETQEAKIAQFQGEHLSAYSTPSARLLLECTSLKEFSTAATKQFSYPAGSTRGQWTQLEHLRHQLIELIRTQPTPSLELIVTQIEARWPRLNHDDLREPAQDRLEGIIVILRTLIELDQIASYRTQCLDLLDVLALNALGLTTQETRIRAGLDTQYRLAVKAATYPAFKSYQCVFATLALAYDPEDSAREGSKFQTVIESDDRWLKLHDGLTPLRARRALEEVYVGLAELLETDKSRGFLLFQNLIYRIDQFCAGGSINELELVAGLLRPSSEIHQLTARRNELISVAISSFGARWGYDTHMLSSTIEDAKTLGLGVTLQTSGDVHGGIYREEYEQRILATLHLAQTWIKHYDPESIAIFFASQDASALFKLFDPTPSGLRLSELTVPLEGRLKQLKLPTELACQLHPDWQEQYAGYPNYVFAIAPHPYLTKRLVDLKLSALRELGFWKLPSDTESTEFLARLSASQGLWNARLDAALVTEGLDPESILLDSTWQREQYKAAIAMQAVSTGSTAILETDAFKGENEQIVSAYIKQDVLENLVPLILEIADTTQAHEAYVWTHALAEIQAAWEAQRAPEDKVIRLTTHSTQNSAGAGAPADEPVAITMHPVRLLLTPGAFRSSGNRYQKSLCRLEHLLSTPYPKAIELLIDSGLTWGISECFEHHSLAQHLSTQAKLHGEEVLAQYRSIAKRYIEDVVIPHLHTSRARLVNQLMPIDRIDNVHEAYHDLSRDAINMIMKHWADLHQTGDGIWSDPELRLHLYDRLCQADPSYMLNNDFIEWVMCPAACTPATSLETPPDALSEPSITTQSEIEDRLNTIQKQLMSDYVDVQIQLHLPGTDAPIDPSSIDFPLAWLHEIIRKWLDLNPVRSTSPWRHHPMRQLFAHCAIQRFPQLFMYRPLYRWVAGEDLTQAPEATDLALTLALGQHELAQTIEHIGENGCRIIQSVALDDSEEDEGSEEQKFDPEHVTERLMRAPLAFSLPILRHMFMDHVSQTAVLACGEHPKFFRWLNELEYVDYQDGELYKRAAQYWSTHATAQLVHTLRTAENPISMITNWLRSNSPRDSDNFWQFDAGRESLLKALLQEHPMCVFANNFYQWFSQCADAPDPTITPSTLEPVEHIAEPEAQIVSALKPICAELLHHSVSDTYAYRCLVFYSTCLEIQPVLSACEVFFTWMHERVSPRPIQLLGAMRTSGYALNLERLVRRAQAHPTNADAQEALSQWSLVCAKWLKIDLSEFDDGSMDSGAAFNQAIYLKLVGNQQDPRIVFSQVLYRWAWSGHETHPDLKVCVRSGAHAFNRIIWNSNLSAQQAIEALKQQPGMFVSPQTRQELFLRQFMCHYKICEIDEFYEWTLGDAQTSELDDLDLSLNTFLSNPENGYTQALLKLDSAAMHNLGALRMHSIISQPSSHIALLIDSCWQKFSTLPTQAMHDRYYHQMQSIQEKAVINLFLRRGINYRKVFKSQTCFETFLEDFEMPCNLIWSIPLARLTVYSGLARVIPHETLTSAYLFNWVMEIAKDQRSRQEVEDHLALEIDNWVVKELKPHASKAGLTLAGVPLLSLPILSLSKARLKLLSLLLLPSSDPGVSQIQDKYWSEIVFYLTDRAAWEAFSHTNQADERDAFAELLKTCVRTRWHSLLRLDKPRLIPLKICHIDHLDAIIEIFLARAKQQHCFMQPDLRLELATCFLEAQPAALASAEFKRWAFTDIPLEKIQAAQSKALAQHSKLDWLQLVLLAPTSSPDLRAERIVCLLSCPVLRHTDYRTQAFLVLLDLKELSSLRDHALWPLIQLPDQTPETQSVYVACADLQWHLNNSKDALSVQDIPEGISSLPAKHQYLIVLALFETRWIYSKPNSAFSQALLSIINPDFTDCTHLSPDKLPSLLTAILNVQLNAQSTVSFAQSVAFWNRAMRRQMMPTHETLNMFFKLAFSQYQPGNFESDILIENPPSQPRRTLFGKPTSFHRAAIQEIEQTNIELGDHLGEHRFKLASFLLNCFQLHTSSPKIAEFIVKSVIQDWHCSKWKADPAVFRKIIECPSLNTAFETLSDQQQSKSLRRRRQYSNFSACWIEQVMHLQAASPFSAEHWKAFESIVPDLKSQRDSGGYTMAEIYFKLRSHGIIPYSKLAESADAYWREGYGHTCMRWLSRIWYRLTRCFRTPIPDLLPKLSVHESSTPDTSSLSVSTAACETTDSDCLSSISAPPAMQKPDHPPTPPYLGAGCVAGSSSP